MHLQLDFLVHIIITYWRVFFPVNFLAAGLNEECVIISVEQLKKPGITWGRFYKVFLTML